MAFSRIICNHGSWGGGTSRDWNRQPKAGTLGLELYCGTPAEILLNFRKVPINCAISACGNRQRKGIMMSKILDAITKAELARKNLLNGPGDSKKAVGNGRHEAASGSADWRTIPGSLSRADSAAESQLMLRRKKPRYYYGAGLVVAMVAGMILDRYLVAQMRPIASRQVQAQEGALSQPVSSVFATVVPRKPHLPSCIPLEAEDLVYASGHPGWQRYQTESTEFRVFLERDSAKAIQVRARRERPLSADFVTVFLSQVADLASYRITSRVKKDGYLIEKGVLGRLAEVVIYRRIPDNGIRALVVVYLAS